MDVNEIFGLPMHPLVVHAAVVLLPLAAFGTLVVAAWPRARRHYAPLALVAAILALGAVGLAQQSGEALEESVTETALVRDHTSQGESVLPWAFVVTVAAAGAAAASMVADRAPRLRPRTITTVLVAAALIGTIGSTWTVVSVGHSGAKAAWTEPADGP